MLYLYNSLTREKERFIPIRKNKVTMYVCGITPYDTTHLGHAFTYISFDILVRVLKNAGYKVVYTQNVTDINDRDKDILQRAKEQNISWNNLADFWTKKFLNDMKALNWMKPDYYIKASDYIGETIGAIQKLLKNGYAYQKNGSVYFDVNKKKDYGKLSKLNKGEMLKTAKDFEEDTKCPDKKNPLDITLWRAYSPNQSPHIPYFKSPFGPGRPGWHIECSSMSISTLGKQIDIHGGGMDLIYPHHEAEIAQSEGATLKIPFAKYWIHTSPVSYKGKKMSKSLGNLVMISDLFKKYSADTIRWYLISHHYRQPFEFFEKDLEKSKKELSKISRYLEQTSDPAFDEELYKKFIDTLENDLDTPSAIKIIKEIINKKRSIKTLKKCLLILGLAQ